MPVLISRPTPIERWSFQAFDQYGHTTVYAHTGDNREECEAEARWHVEHQSEIPGYGECCAVLWAPGETHGTLIQRSEVRE
jgi:hypothetical protein